MKKLNILSHVKCSNNEKSILYLNEWIKARKEKRLEILHAESELSALEVHAANLSDLTAKNVEV